MTCLQIEAGNDVMVTHIMAEAAAWVASSWEHDLDPKVRDRAGDGTWWTFPTSGKPDREQLQLLEDDARPPWVDHLNNEARSLYQPT